MSILVYSKDAAFPEKQRTAENLVRRGFDTGEGKISSQVLNEFYVTVTRKLAPGMNKDEAVSLCGSLESLDPYIIDLETIRDAIY